ncbi:S8 family serine peptidase, partial [Streptomyces sp. NPDC051940]|uniref:S8 family serine peptidase n=1 Tax=Streptomyces sp. NPDC051940 TaxID=3155675 RepID=UPI003431D5C8
MLSRASAGVIAAGIALAAVPGPTAGATTADARPPAPGAGGTATSVTLITGDRVELPAGTERPVIIPAPGRGAYAFRISHDGGHLRVVPADAAGLVGSGRLDARLFDVTELARLGYDDPRRADTPLIVRYRHDPPGKAPAGARTTRRLPGLRASAVSVSKHGAAGFWNAVTTSRAPLDRRLDPDIAGVWLSGKRKAVLDRSAAQIGAPAAWQLGRTGKQVTVAVIDSGIDTTHPDLAGKVADAANFTGEEAGDHNGHGTHVASVVGGTGAASGGRYRGIAPDVRLLDAKACDAEGSCYDDAVLAAMEWAAATKRAPVVNMSLGSQDWPGTDPLEQAVDDLSRRYGTLFVVAAGNNGTAQGVDSPGSADAALTVGAVDRDDSLAGFSSRGPRVGDHALKPDLTAPGTDIVAARAAGTHDGDGEGAGGTQGGDADGPYVALSGTSMATPHVAGTAALLLQEHPDWDAARLKSALMGSAAPAPGVAGFDQGAGRVDAARAVTQEVTASPPAAGFGIARWPHEDDGLPARTVGYRNTGAADVTLDLALEAVDGVGSRAPDGLLRLSTTRLTVPAGGSAEVTVTADTASPSVAPGSYSGQLLAVAGQTRVSTPVGVVKEDERYDLTLRHLGRDGATPGSHVVYLDRIGDCPDDSSCLFAEGGSQEVTTFRVPPGDYSLGAYSSVDGRDGLTLLMQPVLHVAADTSVTLDAGKAKPLVMSAPDDSVRLLEHDLSALLKLGRGAPPNDTVSYTMGGEDSSALYSGHLGEATPREDDLVSYVHGVFADPGTGDFADSPVEYQLAGFRRGRLHDGVELHPRGRDFAKVHTTVSATSDDKRWVRSTSGAIPAEGPATPSAFVAGLVSHRVPFSRTRYFLAEGVRWGSSF